MNKRLEAYLQKKMKHLMGATISGLAFDPNEDVFGLVVTVEGSKSIVWILSDEEGNSGGAVDIQAMEHSSNSAA